MCSRRSLRNLLLSVVAVASVVMPSTQAQAQQTALAARVGTPAGATDIGPVPASQMLQLTLFVAPTPDRSAALDAYLADTVTAGSSHYHKWLTPQEFSSQFGATADQSSALSGWIQNQGLSVVSTSAGGTSLIVSGTASRVAAAFSTGLRQFAAGSNRIYAPSVQPSLPQSVSSLVVGISGLDNVQALSTPLKTISSAGVVTAMTGTDPLVTAARAIDGNASPILLFSQALCSADVAAGPRTVYENLLRQANAQGITVLAETSCSANGSFPAGLAEAMAVGPEMGSGITSIAPRPGWQSAPGLPDDANRQEPDFTATDFNAFAQTIATLVQQTGGRLGNINSVLYSLSPTPDLFVQPDNAAAGTWEPSTGLGVVNLDKLLQVFPRGTGTSFASLSASAYSINYGQSDTFTSTVTSGVGGAVPTGTVTFASGGTTLCNSPLVTGTATCTPTTPLKGGSNTVTATYNGDGTYAAATSPNVTVYVGGEESQLSAVVSTGNTYGGTFTVTVTDTGASGVGVPTGTVTVTTPVNGNTYPGTLAQASSNSASAVISVPSSLVGTITLSVTCTATANFSCDNPYTTTVTIGKATPAVSFNYTPANATSGATVNLSATVAAVGTGVTPTGNVSFNDNSTVLNAARLSGGTASTTGQLPTAATHSLNAAYDGDANYLAAVSGSSSNGGSVATTTSITASDFGPAYGAATTLTATVAAQSGSATPTGSISFTDSVAGSLGTASVNASGVASLSISTLALGSHTISAAYTPTGNFNASTSSAPVTIAVVKATPAGTLIVSPNPPVTGSPYTLTVTIPATGSTTPTGTVVFQDNGNVLSSSVPLVNGVATYSGTLSNVTARIISIGRPNATVAAHSFTAAYSGDSNYNGTSVSSSATSATGTSATTTTLTSSSAAPTTGTAITLTAQVSGTAGTATGSVVFTDSVAGSLGSAPLTLGVATLQVSTLAAGNHSITAAYGGDSLNAPSTSTAVPVAVSAGSGSGALTATLTAASAGYGNTDSVTVTVTPTDPTTTVSGSVKAVVNGKTYTGAIAAGAGSITFDVPPPGSYSVVVSCVAPVSCTGSPVTLPLMVTKGATTTTVTSSSNAPSAGSPVTLTAVIAQAGNGTGPYTFTGNVVFLDGNTSLGTAMITGNQAVLTVTMYGAKSHSITALYSGDTNWFGSTSTATSVLTAALPATLTLTSNATTALAGTVVNFTLVVSDPPSILLAPSGTITLYDTFGGIVRTLGTAGVFSTGPGSGLATYSTSALTAGVHSIYAIYSGDTNFATGTSNTVSLNMVDYSAGFVPPSATVTRGNNLQAAVQISAISGFTGQVSLGCTPPANSETACSFSPAVITGSGISTLTISTTQAKAKTSPGNSTMLRLSTGVGLAMMLGIFLPRRRRALKTLLLLMFAVALTMNIGCAVTGTSGSDTGQTTGDPGSPLGTGLFTITTAGTDGINTIRHNYQYQVTIQ